MVIFVQKVLLLIAISFLFFNKRRRSKLNLLNDQKFRIIAHRGASAHAPENTIESFQLAKEMGADYIEMDLHLTKDGHLIVIHDETVDRTTDGTGNVRELTLTEIKQLDAGSWFSDDFKGVKVPTMEEVFNKFGHDINYCIEIKSPNVNKGIEEKLLTMLNKYKLLGKVASKGKVIIQSFNKKSLINIHEMNRSIPLVQLMKKNEIEKYDFTKVKEYAIGIGPNYKGLNNNLIKRVREEGLLIHPYTIDDPLTINKLKKLGITGVITNDPNIIKFIENLKQHI